MSIESSSSVQARVAKHAALADAVRLSIVDQLRLGDASPSELQTALGVTSNLLAHHLKVLEDAGVATRRRSQGDRRRSYVTLTPGGLDDIEGTGPRRPAHGDLVDRLDHAERVVFVCTANSARSQLATALWTDLSRLPATSAGTHPAPRIAPGAAAAARRHRFHLPKQAPRHVDQVVTDGDLVISVCDTAHEELAGRDAAHWAVPDPVPAGTPTAYDETVADLDRRLHRLVDAQTVRSWT